MLLIFLLVYLGMFLGGIPGLALDRTGVALLGAIALLAFGYIDTREAVEAVDIPTIALLLGIRITWAEHARAGVPVTLLTLLGAAAWLWLVAV